MARNEGPVGGTPSPGVSAAHTGTVLSCLTTKALASEGERSSAAAPTADWTHLSRVRRLTAVPAGASCRHGQGTQCGITAIARHPSPLEEPGRLAVASQRLCGPLAHPAQRPGALPRPASRLQCPSQDHIACQHGAQGDAGPAFGPSARLPAKPASERWAENCEKLTNHDVLASS